MFPFGDPIVQDNGSGYPSSLVMERSPHLDASVQRPRPRASTPVVSSRTNTTSVTNASTAPFSPGLLPEPATPSRVHAEDCRAMSPGPRCREGPRPVRRERSPLPCDGPMRGAPRPTSAIRLSVAAPAQTSGPFAGPRPNGASVALPVGKRVAPAGADDAESRSTTSEELRALRKDLDSLRLELCTQRLELDKQRDALEAMLSEGLGNVKKFCYATVGALELRIKQSFAEENEARSEDFTRIQSALDGTTRELIRDAVEKERRARLEDMAETHAAVLACVKEERDARLTAMDSLTKAMQLSEYEFPSAQQTEGQWGLDTLADRENGLFASRVNQRSLEVKDPDAEPFHIQNVPTGRGQPQNWTLPATAPVGPTEDNFIPVASDGLDCVNDGGKDIDDGHGVGLALAPHDGENPEQWPSGMQSFSSLGRLLGR